MEIDLVITVNDDVRRALDRLRRTGLFGNTIEEVASRLLSERLRDQEVAVWFQNHIGLPPGTETLGGR